MKRILLVLSLFSALVLCSSCENLYPDSDMLLGTWSSYECFKKGGTPFSYTLERYIFSPDGYVAFYDNSKFQFKLPYGYNATTGILSIMDGTDEHGNKQPVEYPAVIEYIEEVKSNVLTITYDEGYTIRYRKR
ncbi:MAG: hypothetical protein GX993_01470 [Bacteroidales bacterium]|nr:hypothetical protein [Bacteroidales bacterium]